MAAAAPTTMRDVLGLALLCALCERPRSPAEAVEAVRRLCLPWLTPTREVVGRLVSEYRAAGYLHPRLDPRSGDAGARLGVTPEGERELRRLALHRTGRPAHHLAVLCESLRLAAARRLGPRACAEILDGQIRSRRHCLAVQRGRLAVEGGANPLLVHVLRHRIACAEAELDALVGARREGVRAAASFRRPA